MNTAIPIVKDVVLVGGGHTHALLLRSWGMNPVPGARLTVINPAPTAPYTGMLPGFVAGHYERDELEIDLVRLARFAGARIIFGMVTALDKDTKTLTVADRPPIPFDIASIDIGITSNMPEIPGFAEHAIAAKPLGPFAARWDAFRKIGGPVAVIGGGVAGVELAMAMAHALASNGSVAIIEAASALSGLSEPTRDRLLSKLKAQNIALEENARVATVAADHVTLDDGRTIQAAFTVGAAGARPFPWLAETGLELSDGYLTVDAQLRSLTDPSIYAVGDCAHLSHAPRPKAGVFAVRAAPILTHNIRADLIGGQRKRFNPQSHYLKLVSLGRKAALADKWNRSFTSDWAWGWKDRIDRKFMDRLNHPPAMTVPALPKGTAQGAAQAMGPKPLCGACGAKVGASLLDSAIANLPAVPRADLETTPGDDAAILRFGDTRQVLSTDHLRAFWNDPYVMTRITAQHALGDVWAMGATPQIALAQITLPRMSDDKQALWLKEIMSAAGEVFAAEGASIAGGHTSIGAELVVGFTVTGTTEHATTLGGAKQGDVLILTRPIGVGTLLAGEMEKRANGDDISDMLNTLMTPQGDAARLLAPKARAMTDVTGFGLAGHAARMAESANLSAQLDLNAVPLFAGAETLAAQGMRSTIYEANRAAVKADLPDTSRAALMFDPQTAGGLLAAVPESEADTLVAQLSDLGHTAAQIGQFVSPEEVRLRAL
ncbi:MAG: selenide, water dikinase SelD [Paracoccaceae bacterium]